MLKAQRFKEINNDLNNLEWNNFKSKAPLKKHLRSTYDFILVKLALKKTADKYPLYVFSENDARVTLAHLHLVRSIGHDSYALTNLGRKYVHQSFHSVGLLFLLQETWDVIVSFIMDMLLVSMMTSIVYWDETFDHFIATNNWSTTIGSLVSSAIDVACLLIILAIPLFGIVWTIMNHKNPLIYLFSNNTEGDFIDFVDRYHLLKNFNPQRLMYTIQYSLFNDK